MGRAVPKNEVFPVRPLAQKSFSKLTFKQLMIFDYVLSKHIKNEPNWIANYGPWYMFDLRLFDNAWMYIQYPPFNFLPAMFCGTKGGFQMNNLMKRSRRIEGCANKNTCIETPHNYYNNEVGCHL